MCMHQRFTLRYQLANSLNTEHQLSHDILRYSYHRRTFNHQLMFVSQFSKIFAYSNITVVPFCLLDFITNYSLQLFTV